MLSLIDNPRSPSIEFFPTGNAAPARRRCIVPAIVLLFFSPLYIRARDTSRAYHVCPDECGVCRSVVSGSAFLCDLRVTTGAHPDPGRQQVSLEAFLRVERQSRTHCSRKRVERRIKIRNNRDTENFGEVFCFFF